MLTLAEILTDTAASPGFEGIQDVEPNSRGAHGVSPLHWMATLGDAEGIRLLIEAGANINATDDQGNTALHEAVARRQTSAAKMLIERGASIGMRNVAGQTPLNLAKSDGFAPTVGLFQAE
jgi:ankyrin repeat protein